MENLLIGRSRSSGLRGRDLIRLPISSSPPLPPNNPAVVPAADQNSGRNQDQDPANEDVRKIQPACRK